MDHATLRRHTDVVQRLEYELRSISDRLRGVGAAAQSALDASLSVLSATRAGDEIDAARLNQERELTFTTRTLLIGRANKLASALQRLRAGEYGLCGSCGQPIPAARLSALPEVETCVPCQDRLEREARRARIETPEQGELLDERF